MGKKCPYCDEGWPRTNINDEMYHRKPGTQSKVHCYIQYENNGPKQNDFEMATQEQLDKASKNIRSVI